MSAGLCRRDLIVRRAEVRSIVVEEKEVEIEEINDNVQRRKRWSDFTAVRHEIRRSGIVIAGKLNRKDRISSLAQSECNGKTRIYKKLPLIL
jgi:hypothetical protein